MGIYDRVRILKQLGSAALALILIIALPAVSIAQRPDEGERRNKLFLTLNARVNGYKVIERGEDDFYVQILGATNPQTGKKLNGTHDFVYRCKLIAGLIVVVVILAKGRAEERLRCRMMDDPYLYY